MSARGFRLEHVSSTVTIKQMWQHRLEDLNNQVLVKTSVSPILTVCTVSFVSVIFS